MMLSRQLTTKFGALPDHVGVQLDEATEDELLGCAERVLIPRTLDEVLLPVMAHATERGVREGVRQTVSRLLTMRFKGLPDRTVEWLDRATKDELLDRCVRVLTAATIDEVTRLTAGNLPARPRAGSPVRRIDRRAHLGSDFALEELWAVLPKVVE